MRNSLMVLTGTLRAFDGYDRWEKCSVQEFGLLEELQLLKQTFENQHNSNRKYINLDIRQATEQEKEKYKQQLETQIQRNEKEYQDISKKKEQLSALIQASKLKVQQLEEVKIPH